MQINEDIIYRKAAVSDAQKISRLNNICLDVFWSEKMFSEELQDDLKHYFVAEKQNEIVGFIGFTQILDEAHIMNVAVNEAYRKQKIATKLFSLCEKEIKTLSISAITLEVSEYNIIAVNFYEKLGFKLFGRRPNYYKDKSAALIYWLYL